MQQHIYNEFDALERTHWWFVSRRRFIETVVIRFFGRKKGLNFIEIGCGTGGNLAMLAQYAAVDAVEMNDQARATADAKNITGVSSIQSGYLPDQIPQTKCYDGVFALDIIEHVKDDLAGLIAMGDVLEDRGLLVMTVPAYQWLWSEHDEANHHFRRYTKNQYVQLVEQAGYEIRYATYYNTLLFPLAALVRVAGVLKKDRSNNASTLTMPAKFVNRLFTWIFGLERHWAGKLVMPFGLSVLVVAQKANR